LNQKAVNLHLIEDVLGWFIVLLGSCVMKITGFVRLDSIVSVCVACFILWNTIKNFISIIYTMGEKVPAGISVEEIKHHLLEIDGVKDAHHIHIWSLDGNNNNCATLHIVSDENSIIIKKKVKEELREHNILHITVEIETSSEICNDEECNINVEMAGCCCHTHHHSHSH
jgi:cobalt-zinc-cadmium efflux system protein